MPWSPYRSRERGAIHLVRLAVRRLRISILRGHLPCRVLGNSLQWSLLAVLRRYLAARRRVVERWQLTDPCRVARRSLMRLSRRAVSSAGLTICGLLLLHRLLSLSLFVLFALILFFFLSRLPFFPDLLEF